MVEEAVVAEAEAAEAAEAVEAVEAEEAVAVEVAVVRRRSGT